MYPDHTELPYDKELAPEKYIIFGHGWVGVARNGDKQMTMVGRTKIEVGRTKIEVGRTAVPREQLRSRERVRSRVQARRVLVPQAHR